MANLWANLWAIDAMLCPFKGCVYTEFATNSSLYLSMVWVMRMHMLGPCNWLLINRTRPNLNFGHNRVLLTPFSLPATIEECILR